MNEIRKATADDLETIRGWLQQEKDDGYDSFICNISMIQDGQREGWLTVLVEEIPIAFALGDQSLSIFAVKRDRRGGKVGTKLAQHCFQDACERDVIGFKGECSPISSLPFWLRMGCTQIRSTNEKPRFIKPLALSRDLPEGAEVDALSFQLYDSNGKAIPGWGVVKTAIVADDDYMLSRDFIAYVPEEGVRLEIWGKNRFSHAKLSEIEDIGGDRRGPWIRVRNLVPN